MGFKSFIQQGVDKVKEEAKERARIRSIAEAAGKREREKETIKTAIFKEREKGKTQRKSISSGGFLGSLSKQGLGSIEGAFGGYQTPTKTKKKAKKKAAPRRSLADFKVDMPDFDFKF